MANQKYIELLKDPRWQKKRLEAMQAAGWKCRECGATSKTLNVHHKKYRSGAMPWQYELDDLAVLCEDCHKGEHDPGKAEARRKVSALRFDHWDRYEDGYAGAIYFSVPNGIFKEVCSDGISYSGKTDALVRVATPCLDHGECDEWIDDKPHLLIREAAETAAMYLR